MLAVAVVDDELRGRFFAFPVALASATFGIALTRRWLAWSAVALATLTALVADFPELPEVHNNLAVLHAARGNLDLAKTELELAIAASPEYAPAIENLGDVYARLAARQYERAIALEKGKGAAPAKLKLVRDALAAP